MTGVPAQYGGVGDQTVERLGPLPSPAFRADPQALGGLVVLVYMPSVTVRVALLTRLVLVTLADLLVLVVLEDQVTLVDLLVLVVLEDLVYLTDMVALVALVD